MLDTEINNLFHFPNGTSPFELLTDSVATTLNTKENLFTSRLADGL